MPRQRKKVMSSEAMKKLATETSDRILNELNNTERGFENFLRQRTYNGIEVDVALQLIVNACESTNLGGVNKLLNSLYAFEETFLKNDILKIIDDHFVKDYQIHIEKFVKNYLTILHHLFKKIKKSLIIEIMPQLENVINTMQEGRKKTSHLKELLKSVKKESERQNQPVLEQPQSIKDMSIFPKPEDIHAYSVPILEPNKIDGAYKDVDHYLSVQFRLMRQDMINSFRDVLQSIKKDNSDGNFKMSQVKHSSDTLYGDVEMSDRPEYSKNGTIYTFSFKHKSKVTEGKTLLPNSLVCLSNDHYEDSLIFATIKNQVYKNEKCFLDVVVETDVNIILPEKKYEMLITSAYFESYRNVLSTLQQLAENNFPLVDYIVYLDPSNSNPSYDENPFCLHEYCPGKKIADLAEWNSDHRCKLFKVLNHEEWPTPEELNLDFNQLQAFQAALTQKLAIIQGPPGTGKTYLGVKIVKALLENTDKTPIVICCLTNHALDQFLMRLLKDNVTRKIVRIGMQSTSDEIRKRSLQNLSNALNKYREGKECEAVFLSDEEEEMLNIAEELNPNIKTLQKPWSRCDKEELQLSDLCVLLNNYTDLLINLLGNFMNFNSLYKILPESVLKTFNDSHSAKELQQFVAKWLDIDSKDDVVKRCKCEWKKMGEKNLEVNDEDCILKSKENFNVWTIPLNERYRLLYNWRLRAQKYVESKIESKKQIYNGLVRKCNSPGSEREKRRINYDHLVLGEAADIIGMTMTGAAKYRHLLGFINPRIMIIEEAAESLEAHIISSLVPSIEHLILIGDHKQLRPITCSDELAKKYNFNISLFERLVNNNIPHVTLTTQHRMRSSISDLLVPHIYEELKCHKSVEAYEKIKGIEHDVFFLNHEEPEDEQTGTSISNKFEAKFITKLALFLTNIGYETKQLTILGMYNAQISLIQKYLHESKPDILVTTVDNYQGEENDIILVSVVRSNSSDNIGFLKESNRLCVALSRARKGLYCIGNFNMLARKSDFWSNVVDKLRNNDCIGEQFPVQCPIHKNVIFVMSCDDFDYIEDEGGCKSICDYVLPCGHQCEYLCHFCDLNHIKYICNKPCNKVICIQRKNKIKERLCKRRCSELCEDSKSVERNSCGHVRILKYNQQGNLEDQPCVFNVEKILACGHIDSVPCSVPTTIHECRALVQVTLKCGHKKKLPCPQQYNIKHVICTELKSCLSPCGHKVFIPCHMHDLEDDILLAYCEKICDTLLDCGHPCMNPCSWCQDMKIHSSCCTPCEQKLFCGHKCHELCGAPCSECPPHIKCNLGCEHSPCINPCLEPCVQCKEPCLRKCPHQHCKKLCYEECDIPPCPKPCKKLLNCGHHCIGLCGDPCPPLCRICDEDELETENINEDRFIYLEMTCRHVVEVTRISKLFEDEIKLPRCPFCNTTIARNRRFKDDITNSKSLFLQLQDSKYEIVDEVTQQFETCFGDKDDCPPSYFLNIHEKLSRILRNKPPLSVLLRLPTVLSSLEKLYEYTLNKDFDTIDETRFIALVQWLQNNFDTASYQQLREFRGAVLVLTSKFKI